MVKDNEIIGGIKVDYIKITNECKDCQYSVENFHLLEISGEVIIEQNETTEIDIRLEKAVELIGKVVDKQSGDPLQNVWLMLKHREAAHHGVSVFTDEEGVFTANVLPGSIWVRTIDVSERYGKPLKNPAFAIEVPQSESHEIDAIEIEFEDK